MPEKPINYRNDVNGRGVKQGNVNVRPTGASSSILLSRSFDYQQDCHTDEECYCCCVGQEVCTCSCNCICHHIPLVNSTNRISSAPSGVLEDTSMPPAVFVQTITCEADSKSLPFFFTSFGVLLSLGPEFCTSRDVISPLFQVPADKPIVSDCQCDDLKVGYHSNGAVNNLSQVHLQQSLPKKSKICVTSLGRLFVSGSNYGKHSF